MGRPKALLTVEADDFARRFSQRAKNLMWFLGAGTSASAGVPTAIDLIWRFKQLLFVSKHDGSPLAQADFTQPGVRARIDAYVNSLANAPVPGAADEYATLFEMAFRAEADRRTFLDSMMDGARPSYGHVALATLMLNDQARVIWTTNFDALVADACAKVYGRTSALTSIDLDSAEQVGSVFAEGRWPAEVKLHGDFRSRRLKNTGDELRHQDAELRKALIRACTRYGLVVCGYSGRDASVMEALEEAVAEGAFPAGLFWLVRSGDHPTAQVTALLEKAVARGIEASLVPVENFDETLRDLVRISSCQDSVALDEFARERSAWSPAEVVRPRRRAWPVVRLNALPIIQAPTQCWRIVCEIGGTGEVAEAVRAADVDVLAVRTQRGVLAFGGRSQVCEAFGSYGIKEIDVESLSGGTFLRYESSERGLLAKSLRRAICRTRGMAEVARNDVVPAEPASEMWSSLRRAVGPIAGSVDGAPEVRWWEGVSLRLDWVADQLCLLFDPRPVMDGLTEANRFVAAEFSRERTVRRYNTDVSRLLDFWAAHLFSGGTPMAALDDAVEMNARFVVGRTTCFSRRA